MCQETFEDKPAVLCACGCGRETGLARWTDKRKGAVKGQHNRFVHGHQRRGATGIDPTSEVRLSDGRRGTVRRCRHCQEPFASRTRDAKYCSKRCLALDRPEVAERVTRWVKEHPGVLGDTLRGRGEGRSYTKRNGQHEHRVVAERKIGRPLMPGEVVHHIDGDRKNNHPDNLEVLPSQSEHARIHARERAARKEASSGSNV